MNADKDSKTTKNIGFIVNPIAGMGGAVGLKGTDGKDILTKAIKLGAKPVATKRAEIFLSEIALYKTRLKLLVGPADMGENQAKKLHFDYKVLGESKTQTTPDDTEIVANDIVHAGVDLLVFCGGDGTSRDILRAVDMNIPVLGVPTGVKMHSAIFAINPKAAARVAMTYLWHGLPIRETEVMDVDEEAFRKGQLSAELYGYMLSPFEPHLIQGNKLASPMLESELENQAAIAIGLIEEMQPNMIYVLGPGTTTRTITDLLDQKKTLLGVDLLQNKTIIATDVNEMKILEALDQKTARIIVTPIGGQGFIFGRGNQQISPKVIRKVGLDNLVVIATKSKLDHLNSLRVDSGDPQLDSEFREKGIRIIIDYKSTKEMTIE